MVPVLSTRAFGRLPDARELALARRFWFLHLEVHLRAPLPSARDLRLFLTAVQAAGIQIPCVHLPADAGDAAEALDLLTDLGARIAVWHPPADEHEVRRLAGRATEAGVRLALETDIRNGPDLPAVRALLRRTGALAEGHGLCLDTSRRRISPSDAESLRDEVRWVEVSRLTPGHSHAPPEPDDWALYDALGTLAPAYLAYEVALEHPSGRAPGEAELANLLGRLNAWHRGGGVSHWRWTTVDSPVG